MVKIGVISDTHIASFKDFPQRVIKALAGVDLILHAGDLVSQDVLEGLKRITPRVKAVRGNMDSAWVKKNLPDLEIIPVEQFRLGLTHGGGAPLNLMNTVKEKFKDKQVDCIVYGHSHTPFNETHAGVLYFNPGSLTDKVYAPYNSYGLLEVGKELVGRIIKI